MSLLETRGLTKRFGGLCAVKDLDMTVREGEIVSLIGPNGAGKTTTFGLLTGLIPPTSGHVVFSGQDITGWPAYRVARLGIVTTFQKTKVFPEVTVSEAVAIGGHLEVKTGWWDILSRNSRFREEERQLRERVDGILDYLGLGHRRDTPCKSLPYGEQRLLEIAVAMAANPRLLLLDEPAAGLNPQESNRLMQLIYGLRDRGITILLVEHDMRLVMAISDRIVVLNFGEKIAEGSPQQVSANEEVIKAYLGEREDDDRDA